MKNKKLRKILIIILIIIVFIGGIFAGKAIEARKYSEDGSETSTQITETTVSTQTIENTLTSSGEVTSSETEKAVNKSFILNEFMQAGNEDENAWILYSSQNNGYPCIKELDN